MRGSLTIVVVTTGLLLSSRGSAQSEPPLPPQYLAVKLGLSLGGSLSAHVDAHELKQSEDTPAIPLAAIDSDSALKSASPLVQIEYLFSADRIFALGPLLGFHSWRSERGSAEGYSSSFGVDLGIVAQPRLPIGSRFELYLSIPLSLTLSVLNEYKTWTERQYADRGAAESVDPAYGWGVGVLLGARYAITTSVGMLLELGWQRYSFTHLVQFQLSSALDEMGSGAGLDLELATSQFRLNAGVFF